MYALRCRFQACLALFRVATLDRVPLFAQLHEARLQLLGACTIIEQQLQHIQLGVAILADDQLLSTDFERPMSLMGVDQVGG